MNENVSEALRSLLPNVNINRKYWLVRSMGGDYYDEFINRRYIAIGYNKVSLSELKLAASYNDEASAQLKQILDSKDLKHPDTEEEKYNSRYAVPQMLKFYSEIKVGDIVVIPGKNSHKVAIAEITSEVYEEEYISPLTGFCQFKKRRNIKVLERTIRHKLNPEMQLMFNSRHIISNVDKYEEFIEGSVRDFYQKGNVTYLVLRVKQQDGISAVDFNVIPEIVNIAYDYLYENKFDFDKDVVKMKVCVQSPGDILIYAVQHPWVIFMIGWCIGIIKGGKINIWDKVTIEIPGHAEILEKILKSISDYMDRKLDREIKEILKRKLEKLEIETPEDIKKIQQMINEGRNKY
jgi:hypothetical protein